MRIAPGPRGRDSDIACVPKFDYYYVTSRILCHVQVKITSYTDGRLRCALHCAVEHNLNLNNLLHRCDSKPFKAESKPL